MKVIAICGMKRVGKDTAAMLIAQEFGYKHVKISGPLKKVCNILFGFSHDQMENETKDCIDERIGISPRKALQFVGTEMMQYKIQELLPTIGRSFWINTLLRQEEGPIVISDMRFLHEAKAIKEQYGNESFIIKVTRPDNSNVDDEHASEKEWSLIKEDVSIVNNKGIPDFLAQVWKVLSEANSS